VFGGGGFGVAKALCPYEWFDSDLRRAHGHSIRHFAELWHSGLCGCFGCLDVFEFKHVREWTDGGQTAVCPNCGIDSVIGDASGFPITEEFLSAMEARWFGLRGQDTEPDSV
jgi:hypothetical protein